MFYGFDSAKLEI